LKKEKKQQKTVTSTQFPHIPRNSNMCRVFSSFIQQKHSVVKKKEKKPKILTKIKKQTKNKKKNYASLLGAEKTTHTLNNPHVQKGREVGFTEWI